MAEYQLTQSQQAVVSDRGGTLLVSAAAGSGKTKVLVDRLMSRICDPASPCNIDDFLVITYTNAAAAELRMKIAQAMSKRIAAEPGNRHLHRQLSRIYLARISTVHALCADLLRTYAYLLDIPADFRLMEESEGEALQTKVLNELLEQEYAKASESFTCMTETFGYGRDDRKLPEAIKMAHRAMRCRADMDSWIDEMLQVLDLSRYETIGQTPWGAYVLREFRLFLSQQILRMQEALDEMQDYPVIERGYGETFRQNIRQMTALMEQSDWDSVCAARLDTFGRLAAVRKPEDVQVKDRIANIRKRCWTELQKWQELFYAPSQELLEDLKNVMPGAEALLRCAKQFDCMYSEEKKKRKLMDFSDLEHLAIRLLTDRYTGKPTAIARTIAAQFIEIMVDEYQDSNQVQEVIFEALSQNGQNRFMVGDVKQSIYRFRLADPTLFLQKYETYPDYLQAEPDAPRKILLSENFRSRPEILAACNDVFRLIMRRQVGDLDYGDAEALKAGKKFAPVPYDPVELHCLTSEIQDMGLDKRDLEAEFVAERVEKLLQEKTLITDGDSLRPVEPGDIVILMRSVSNNASTYLDALARHGIPGVCNRGGSLLETTEVQVLFALLQIIDNPHQDVPLVTVLGSPLFGFTPDQLALPRTLDRTCDYYDCLQAARDRFDTFLTLLDELREDSRWMTLQDLLDHIFRKTKLIYVFSSMRDGLQRERNLMAFRNLVISYENAGSRSLSQLIRYMQELQSNGGHVPLPSAETGNAVSIMSIHKSKGLEFPVVVLADLSRQFNMQDMRDAILVDDELAVGCNCVDTKRSIRYPTLAKKSIEHKKRRETISEELRVLYVAMTRAKDMLIMTYYSKRLLKELETLNSQLTFPISTDVCASVNSPGKWILLAALCRTEAGELHVLTGGNQVSTVHDMPWKIQFHDLTARSVETEAAIQTQGANSLCVDQKEIELMQYRYKQAAACDFPAKLTATQLKGRMQDDEVSDGAKSIEQHTAFRFRRARFLQRSLTAAEKGTALHLFMQFANYERCSSLEGIEEELHRLRSHAFLTSEQIEAVDPERVHIFFSSPRGQWLLNQRSIYREFKFSLLVDAAAFSEEAAGEQVLMQGVVDCFVAEEDGITIFDFKTDQVGRELQKRAAYYRPQLEAYAAALGEIYQMPVKQKLLYFFDANEFVEI